MCGIFGQFNWGGQKPEKDHLCRLTNTLRHRGPDGGGYWADGPFFLGHRRLSIIDLEYGIQPMATSDGALVITYNGEIYNYIELRDELMVRGHKFRTSSDTEVLLNGYVEWGKDLPGKLVGMFAFAIVDRIQRTLFLARDPFGEKPLLYYETSEGVSFASELRALAGLPGFSPELDRMALAPYLCLNYSPSDRTLMEGIRRVKPGTWRFYDRNGFGGEGIHWSAAAQYQKGFNSDMTIPLEEAIKELKERLDHAVRISLRSDVPVGLFLSGGIDSSIIAESAVRQGALTHAFCLDFEDIGFSEWKNAKFVADRLGLTLHRVNLSSADIHNFLRIVEHADDPLADSSSVAVWALAKEASGYQKVIVSGDGGDELFAGYLTYKATALHTRFISPLPSKMRNFLSSLTHHIPINEAKASASYKLIRFLRAANRAPGSAHFTWNGSWMPEEAAELLVAESDKKAVGSCLEGLAERHRLGDNPHLIDLQLADIGDYLPNDILTKVDRMSMAHSLEVRAPFLNPLVAEFALNLPDSMKLTLFGKPKMLLRELVRRLYGPEIGQAKKQGFSIPIHSWLRGSARDLVEDLLSPHSISNIGIFNMKAVLKAKDSHMSGRQSLGFELWGLMVFIAWHRARIDLKPVLPDYDPADLVQMNFSLTRPFLTT